MKHLIVIFLLINMGSSLDLFAQDPPSTPALQIGSAAPTLRVKHWLKGEPILSFEKGKVYVVEFWATWCFACIKNIPHLTELAKKHADDLTIVGISVREQEGATGTVERVQAFVDKMGDRMDYTVAMDDPIGQEVFEDWMMASGLNGIPAAFVVDRLGQIVWMGHPMGPNSGLEDAVSMAVEGTLDLNAMKREQADTTDDIQRYARAELEAHRINREMLVSGKYQELVRLGTEKSKSSDWTQQELGRQHLFLAHAFLDTEKTAEKIRATLAKETEEKYTLLSILVTYADLLPPLLISETIRTLQADGDSNTGGFLADIYYQTGRFSDALKYLDRHLEYVEATSADPEEDGYLHGLKMKREKFEAAIKGRR